LNSLYYGFGSLTEILLLLAGTLVVIVAQIKVKGAYSKYSNVNCNKNLAGCEVARKILDNAGLDKVHVVEVKGELTDHYDPKQKVVRLSSNIFHGTSIASVAVAAHECGHAIQDKDNYTFMRIRASLVPVVNFVNKFGYLATIIGLVAGILDIIIVGIVMLIATLLFQVITLPVEFNASNRAKNIINELNLATENEQEGVKTMLSAAAFTYVAGVINTLFQLLRLLVRVSDRD